MQPADAFLYLVLGLLILLFIVGAPCFALFLVYLVMELVDDWKYSKRNEQ